MSNILTSLEKAFEIDILNDFFKSTNVRKFQLKSKLPIELPCDICRQIHNSGKSKTYRSVDSLIRHIDQCHQRDQTRNPTKDEYKLFLFSLSIILQTLENSVGQEYRILMKSLQYMVRKELIR